MTFKTWLETDDREEQRQRDEAFQKQLLEKYPDLEDLHVYQKDNHIFIRMIRVSEGKRGEGTGTAVMQEIQRYAASLGLPIVLNPQPDRGKKAALERFYKSLGFKWNRGRYKDYTLSSPFGSTMVWRP